MKIYEKKIGGKNVRKLKNEIVIRRDGRMTYNPTEEMILADGWVEYVPTIQEHKEPTQEEILENKRKEILERIEEYDKSSDVNSCNIIMNGQIIPYWADKSERSSLMIAVKGYMDQGRDVYRLDLRDAGFYISVGCQRLLEMLSELETYAVDCYNRTTDHIFNVKRLQSVDELEAYDYRNGYPYKLTFNF